MDMHKNINWNLIHRYLSGECTPEEKREVQAWLKEDPAHREFLEAIKKVWEVTPGYDVAVDLNAEWRHLSQRLGMELDESYTHSYSSGSPKARSVHQPRKDNPVRQLLRVAAIILLVAVPALYFVDFDDPSRADSSGTEVAMQKVQTATGERAKLEFSDGSRVMLNSMSTLRFPKVFEGSRREIYLEGEAFFRIAHKEDLPFVVRTGEVAVKVLGTEFNVNAYDNKEAVEVVVKEGKVAVRQKLLDTVDESDAQSLKNNSMDPIPEVVLTKGQRTLVRAGQLPSQPEQVALAPHLGWVNGQMVFDGSPLKDVIRRLERIYELHFEVADTTLLSRRLKASFKRERPEKVAGLIAFSLELGYELRGDTVMFKPNPKRSTQ